MSNYEITKHRMEKKFLEYDQERMIRKFQLPHDGEYLYIEFVGRRYRIGRGNGEVTWSKDGSADRVPADYNAAMTIYDVLCDSREGCRTGGEFVNMESLSAIRGSSPSTVGGGFFRTMEKLFDHREKEFSKACERLGGTPYGRGDAAYRIPLFTFLPVVVQLWNSDEEFPASLQILPDKNILQYMRYETMWFAVTHLLERIREDMDGDGSTLKGEGK